MTGTREAVRGNGRKPGWHVPVWPLRRGVQVLVIASLLALPLLARYSHYLSARQLDRTMERWDGSLQGELLAATDAAVRIGIPSGEGGVPDRRPRKAILERTRDFHGSPWSARLFGVSLTDLLAGAESIAASRSVRWVLLSSLLVPIAATLLLGRVFCGWICPMGFLFDIGAKLRVFLAKVLEIRPLSVTVPGGSKYVLLGVGLLVALLVGMPILHHLYPPALLGREAHGLVMALFDRAEDGSTGFALVGLTGASVFLLGLVLLEILIAPRVFCRAICPGGALYSLLGRYRLLRVRRRAAACTPCGICDRACPRGLGPMTDRTGSECDSCGLCIDVCPPRALKFRVALTDSAYGSNGADRESTGEGAAPGRGLEPPAARRGDRQSGAKVLSGALLFAVLAGAPATARAHHILGIPHYAYDESYPQAPVLKLKQVVGDWEFQLTGYPGNPRPGERSQIHVYMVRKSDGKLYDRPLAIRVWRVAMLGGRETIHEGSAEILENVFKFFLSYSAEGNYEIELAFEDEAGISTMMVPMVVGDPGSPVATLGYFAGGMFLLILVIRAIRIKRERTRRRRGGRETRGPVEAEVPS